MTLAEEFFRSLGRPDRDDIAAALGSAGRWEDHWEWRISTVSEAFVARRRVGLRAQLACDTTMGARVSSVEHASSAISIFDRATISLFYVAGWASWAGWLRLHPGEPGPPYSPERPRNLQERYLRSLAEVVVADRWKGYPPGATVLVGHERIVPTPNDWGGPQEETVVPGYVRLGRLQFTWTSPTVERATQFARIYALYAHDAARVLGWPGDRGLG